MVNLQNPSKLNYSLHCTVRGIISFVENVAFGKRVFAIVFVFAKQRIFNTLALDTVRACVCTASKLWRPLRCERLDPTMGSSRAHESHRVLALLAKRIPHRDPRASVANSRYEELDPTMGSNQAQQN